MHFSKRIASVFSLLKQALRGSDQNFTEGSIDRAIFLLSVPMVLEMAMEALFAVVDALFVSRLHDNDAIATVGLTESILAIVYSLGMGLSMGATALVARRIGEKDQDGAGVAAFQSLYIGLLITLLITIVGIFSSNDILRLMGASEGIIMRYSGYTRWMLCGNFTIIFLFLINGIFRGAGSAAIAMRALWIANGMNMILDPIFIFGWGPIPAFGVEGASIATNIGRGSGIVYQVYHLFLKDNPFIRITVDKLSVRGDIIWNIIKVSAGSTGQFLIGSASWIFLYRIIATFGSAAMAGYTYGLRVIVFAILPAWGMANAAATLVGQNLGAQRPDRAEKSVWRAGFFNMVFMAFVMIVFLFSTDVILGFFTADPDVLLYGTQCLQIVCLGYIFYSYGMVVTQSFNGAGDTFTPTILSVLGFWLFQIPVAYLLAKTFGFGPKGVYFAIVISESLMAIAGIIIFRRGKWKQIKI